MLGKRPMRVLYCETNVDGTIGGSYYSLLYLTKNLDRQRFIPQVAFYAANPLQAEFHAAGVDTVVLARPATVQLDWPRGSWFARPRTALQKAINVGLGLIMPTISRAAFLIRHRVDIVHLNNSVLYNHDWMLAASLTGRTCVSHERGINARYSSAARFLAARLDAVVCISEAVRNAMMAAGVRPDNLRTIHNGLDPAEVAARIPRAELRRHLGFGDDAEVVVMVGNLKEWKGQATLVAAMAQVRRSRPKAVCVLVGATGPADLEFEATLRGDVARLRLQDAVVFSGYRKDVAEFLMLADVVVHASIRPEPFGRVLLEAMAAQKPLVAARDGGVLEIVVDGVTGLLFPPGDSGAMATAIVELLSDRALAVRMGRAGFERLHQRFHIADNVAKTQRLYEELTGGRR